MSACRVRRVPPDRIVLSFADRRRTIVETIRRARRRIDLSIFRCDDPEVLAELARAAARGVAVHVLLTPRAKGGRARLSQLRGALERGGARVRSCANRAIKYHAKYLVVDEGPAVIATLNLTTKCFTRTFDALVVTHDAGVISGLRDLMTADIKGVKIPDTLSPRLIVGPERARRQLAALLDTARSSVRVIDSKLSDIAFIRQFERRRAEGLTVEHLGGKWLGALKSHGRAMLIDDRTAVVGSVALAPVSLDERRELAITVDHQAAVKELGLLFEALHSDAAPARIGEVAVIRAPASAAIAGCTPC